MAKILVRGGRPLAGYSQSGMRIVVTKGGYEAHVVEHIFPKQDEPEAALEISNAHATAPLFVKCAEHTNDIEWDQFPDGGHPYFIRA